MIGTEAKVSFYAFRDDAYGLHRVGEIDDPDVIWYDTEQEALKMRLNSNDCVLYKYFEEVK